jgi:hypothetical protein
MHTSMPGLLAADVYQRSPVAVCICDTSVRNPAVDLPSEIVHRRGIAGRGLQGLQEESDDHDCLHMNTMHLTHAFITIAACHP